MNSHSLWSTFISRLSVIQLQGYSTLSTDSRKGFSQEQDTALSTDSGPGFSYTTQDQQDSEQGFSHSTQDQDTALSTASGPAGLRTRILSQHSGLGLSTLHSLRTSRTQDKDSLETLKTRKQLSPQSQDKDSLAALRTRTQYWGLRIRTQGTTRTNNPLGPIIWGYGRWVDCMLMLILFYFIYLL